MPRPPVGVTGPKFPFSTIPRRSKTPLHPLCGIGESERFRTSANLTPGPPVCPVDAMAHGKLVLDTEPAERHSTCFEAGPRKLQQQEPKLI